MSKRIAGRCQAILVVTALLAAAVASGGTVLARHHPPLAVAAALALIAALVLVAARMLRQAVAEPVERLAAANEGLSARVESHGQELAAARAEAAAQAQATLLDSVKDRIGASLNNLLSTLDLLRQTPLDRDQHAYVGQIGQLARAIADGIKGKAESAPAPASAPAPGPEPEPNPSLGEPPPVLDPEVAQYVLDGDRSEVVGTFEACLGSLRAAITEALSRRDAGALAEAAHSLAGAALSLGAARLGYACRGLEVAANTGDWPQAERLAAAIAQAEAETLAALSA